MPSMLRIPGKGTQIAYKVIGKPSNMQKRTKKWSRIDKQLLFEETSRAR